MFLAMKEPEKEETYTEVSIWCHAAYKNFFFPVGWHHSFILKFFALKSHNIFNDISQFLLQDTY